MAEPIYSGRRFGAFLFDMDGTILTSIAAAERVWAAWAVRHGLDVATFLPTIHGVRASETIRGLGLPGVDVEAEVAALTQAELDDMDGIEPIQGAAAFLSALPQDRWAVVTSAPRVLATRRLEAAGLPLPPLMVAGDDVTNGKPAPDCFLMAAERLGQRPQDCLVFEDAPAGIRAAESAGASVVVVTATHSHPLQTRHHRIASYQPLALQPDGSGMLAVADAARMHAHFTGE